MGPDCHGLTPWRQQVGRPPDGAYVLDAGEGRSEPAAGSGLCTLGDAVRAGAGVAALPAGARGCW